MGDNAKFFLSVFRDKFKVLIATAITKLYGINQFKITSDRVPAPHCSTESHVPSR